MLTIFSIKRNKFRYSELYTCSYVSTNAEKFLVNGERFRSRGQ